MMVATAKKHHTEQSQELMAPGQRTNVQELSPELNALVQQMDADAGQGTSQAAEDNIVPLVRILQSQSPQAMPDKAEYIQGAEPGDILVRSHNLVIKGRDGIEVQPCHFSKAWVEWVPRAQGGGFVGQHFDKPDDAYEYEDPQTGKKLWKRKGTKNDLVETRYHAVLINGAPFVIAFSSAGHTTSRNWMSLMNSFRVPNAPTKTAASYARHYRLTTTLRSNKAGDWYDWKIEDLGWVRSAADYNAGKALYMQMSSGEKTIEAEPASTEVHSSDVPF